jgi:hypothetical protein
MRAYYFIIILNKLNQTLNLRLFLFESLPLFYLSFYFSDI